MYYICFLIVVTVAATVLIKRHLEQKYAEWPTDKTF